MKKTRSLSSNYVAALISVIFIFIAAPNAFASCIFVECWYFGRDYKSFWVDDIMFGSNTNWHWPEFDYTTARLTGTIKVAKDGDYSFTLNSDDGSRLFIDSTLVVNSWWDKEAYNVYGSTYLTEGYHTFQIDYYQVMRGSGLDLYLPNGVAYVDIAQLPIPASLFLLGPGLIGLGAFKRFTRE